MNYIILKENAVIRNNLKILRRVDEVDPLYV